MKKWKYAILVVLTGVSVITHGQSIVWGRSYEDSADVSIHHIIGCDNNGFYVTEKIYPHKTVPNYMPCILLQKYDFSGNRIFSHALVLNDPNNKPYPDDEILFMKHTMLLSLFLADNSTNRLYKVNADGSIDKKGINIGTFQAQHKGYLPDITYQFVLSPEKTTLFAYRISDDDKNLITYSIVKEDLTVVKSGTAKFPFDKDFNITDVAVAGTTAYFLGYVKKESQITLVTLNKAGVMKSTPLSPEGVDIIGSHVLKVDSLGEILFEGFYNSKAAGLSFNPEGPVGYFMMRIDGNSGKVSMNKSVAFDQDLLLRYHPESKLAQGVGGYYGNLMVKNVMENPDKSQVLVAEISQAGSNTSLVTHGNGVQDNFTSVYYTYGDILVFKINPDGSLAWYHDYVKRQENDRDKEAADNIFSFGHCIAGNTMYMIYNDNEKNVSLTTADMLTKDDDFKKAKFGSLELMVQPVDITGNNTIEKKVLAQYTGDDEKSNVYPTSCYQLGDKIIIYKHNDKKGTGQFGQLVMQ